MNKWKILGAIAGSVLVLALVVGAVSSASSAKELTTAEIEDLQFMREEEKLARDVYTALYDVWGSSVFSNIANSEQAHMDAIKTLLDAYGIADPVAGQATGEFTNLDLQALYNQLIADGRQSLTAALQVGAAIEEIDILDLQEAIAQTDQADIQQVYENLMSGSENHLRAFVNSLERQGDSYEPQYLSPAVVDEILNGTAGTGNGAQPSTGNGQGGRGGRQGSQGRNSGQGSQGQGRG